MTIDSRAHYVDTHGAGEEIGVWVNFTDPVEVAGAPTGAQRGQPHTSSSLERDRPDKHSRGRLQEPAVQAEDRDADGIGSAADALALNGGSIRSAAGADAVLDLGDHASVNAADHKVGGGG